MTKLKLCLPLKCTQGKKITPSTDLQFEQRCRFQIQSHLMHYGYPIWISFKLSTNSHSYHSVFSPNILFHLISYFNNCFDDHRIISKEWTLVTREVKNQKGPLMATSESSDEFISRAWCCWKKKWNLPSQTKYTHHSITLGSDIQSHLCTVASINYSFGGSTWVARVLGNTVNDEYYCLQVFGNYWNWCNSRIPFCTFV